MAASGKKTRPKNACCMSTPRCKRCPIRMLADGRLSRRDAKRIFAKSRNRKALHKARLEKDYRRVSRHSSA